MHLRESIDRAVSSRQHVDVQLTAPVFGVVFRYTGTLHVCSPPRELISTSMGSPERRLV
jgi:hypothetical protein